ncbi:MAG: guanine deaminase [Desulfovibrio sp.]|nr:guanine deaminase [Desulfovibrio sp.]
MKILCGSLLTYTDDPFLSDEGAARHEIHGAIAVDGGRIVAVGDEDTVMAQLPPEQRNRAVVVRHPGCLLMPGMIDAHLHPPQMEILGSPAPELVDWLTRHAFPAETKYNDPDYAKMMAEACLDEMLRNGTTTACAFGTVHPCSADALFTAATARNVRIIAGKVAMDRNAPPELLDTAQSTYDDAHRLIDRWHGRGRCEYALTPRFVPACSHEEMEAIGALAKEHPDIVVQSHISETVAEVEWVKSLCPDSTSYAQVYDRYGLLRPRAVYAHGVHLAEAELSLFADRGAAVIHCPSSNLFLGSGLFDIRQAKRPDRLVQVGLGSDVGAGTSFSLLQTLGDAYKVAQLRHGALTGLEACYLATLGSARSLGIDDKVGRLAPGLEADIIALDTQATPLLALRCAQTACLDELLHVLMTLGDDRAVRAVYVAGELWEPPLHEHCE